MASASNPTRVGSINNLAPADLTAERALMLKVFSGEVLTCFDKMTYFLDKHVVQTIPHGKSASFPIIGRMPNAEYHTPGSELTGQQIYHAEQVINIDRKLVSHVFIDDLDEKLLHFDVRSRYAQMMGQKLAETFDNHVARNIVLAARTNSFVTGGDNGLVITQANLASATPATKYTAWLDAIQALAENFMNKNVPKPWYLAMKPSDYLFLIRQMETSGFSLVNSQIGGEGSIAKGELKEVFGVTLLPCPVMPTVDYSAQQFHNVNCSTTVGICWNPEAVATLKLLDLQTEADWDIRRQGWLTVAKYAYGHGVLRPECAVELRTAAPV